MRRNPQRHARHAPNGRRALHAATRPVVVALLLAGASALAGCAGGKDAGGTFVLAFDDEAAARLDVAGVYLRGPGGWVAALANASFALQGDGGNVSAEGKAPAGGYDAVRILLDGVAVEGRAAQLARTGVDLAVNVSVASGGRTELRLAIAWADALFDTADGLAFDPVLARLVLVEDGAQRLRLSADSIRAADGQPPVARMRIFDATGLEAFASSFVAESPEGPVVANAGELVFSATGSAAVRPGARLVGYAWEVDGAPLAGATVRHTTPISGGNLTVRLTVTDSEGGSDSQSVRIAVKPGRAERTYNFTGTATGLLGNGAAEHAFGPILAAELDGAPARLVHATVVLDPGASALPIGDLDVALLDGAGEEVAAASGSGSQHRADEAIATPPADGEWTVVVQPQQAYEAAYTVTVLLTWQGVNPGLEAFLAGYDDGHSHEH